MKKLFRRDCKTALEGFHVRIQFIFRCLTHNHHAATSQDAAMQHEVVRHIEILDRKPVRSTKAAGFVLARNAAVISRDAAEVTVSDIRVGEDRLSERT